MKRIIERIATTIMEYDGENRDWRHYTDDAFGIVRDMREPTVQMLVAASEKTGGDAWKAMIDAILNEDLDML